MVGILYYGVKMLLTSGVLFLYYRLFLRDKTFHQYNRFYLLGTVLVPLLLPLLRVKYFTIKINNENYPLFHQLQQGPVMRNDHLYYPGLFMLSLALVAAFLTGRFVYGIIKILKLKQCFPKEGLDGINLYMTDLEHAPFSYFKNLFWKHTIPMDSTLGRQILDHEMVHIQQRHTYDKIFMELIRSIFWFNPFFYLIKGEIHLIHEYLADKKAVEHSDTKVFARMLLISHFPENALPGTSPLLNTHLKKRLAMLKITKTKFGYARKVLALPLLFTVGFASLVHTQSTQANTKPLKTAQTGNTTEKTTAIAEVGTRDKAQNYNPELNKENLRHIEHDAARTAATAARVRETTYVPGQQQAMMAQQQAMVAQQQAMFAQRQAIVARQDAIAARHAALVARQAIP